MDQEIRLLVPLFLGGASHAAGDTLKVEMDMARRIVGLGHAEFVKPDPQVVGEGRHVAGKDPHERPAESATSLPPTERAATRTGTPDPHHKHPGR